MSHSVLYGITAHVQVLLRGADGEEEVLPATKMSLSLVSAPAHSLMGHRVFLQEVGGGEGAPLSHCKQTSTDGDVKRWTCAKADKSTDKEQRNYSGFSSSSSWLSGRADEDQKMMKRKKKGQSLDWRDLRTSWMLRHSGLHHHLCGHTTRRLSERRRRGGRRKEFWKNNSSLIWRHLCR